MPFDETFGEFGVPSGLVLTNNNLTVERVDNPAYGVETVVGTKAYAQVRKRYFEIRLDVTRTVGVNKARISGIGICNPGANVGAAKTYYDIYTTRIGYNALYYLGAGFESRESNVNGRIRTAVGPSANPTDPNFNIGDWRESSLPSVGQGDLLQIAIDGDYFWCGVNDVWDGDPVAQTGGDTHGCGDLIRPLYQSGEDPSIVTARFLPPFEGAVPSGYAGWEELSILKSPALHIDYAVSPGTDSPIASLYYQARLTGEGNDVPDIVMPISSFSASLQQDADDSLSCVVPDGQRFASVLAERGSGQLQIEQYARHIDGTLSSYQLVAWCEWDQLRLDYGIASQSISLRGRKNVPYRSPRTFIPEGVSFRSNADGIRSLTARLTVDVKPGDTVDYNNEQWIIGQVNMSANPSQGDSMEISEQNEPAGE